MTPGNGNPPPPPEMNRTGYEWLRHFTESQAKVAADVLFLTFGIGQAGATMKLARTDEERAMARTMIEVLEQDRRDLRKHAAELDRVLRDMIANARRNAP